MAASKRMDMCIQSVCRPVSVVPHKQRHALVTIAGESPFFGHFASRFLGLCVLFVSPCVQKVPENNTDSRPGVCNKCVCVVCMRVRPNPDPRFLSHAGGGGVQRPVPSGSVT